MERPMEAWEGMQRHGQDLADRLAQWLSGLMVSPPPFKWPPPPPTSTLPMKPPFDTDFKPIIDIGNRIGQAEADFGASLNGVVQQFFRHLPLPFRPEDSSPAAVAIREAVGHRRAAEALERKAGGAEGFLGRGFRETSTADEFSATEEELGYDSRSALNLGRSQGSINITSTYNSRTNDIESSLVARGDLWRAEASYGSSTSGNESSPLFLIQLGPVLFVRDTTLLFPVHLSKQRLLWYGYDRKNGMHSLCPALWSKHRRWLLMSMICLNPLACSFMDVQFPNGQLTYVAGEGFSTSAFLPILGGLLQAQGHYPGESKFSFSRKNKWGTCITPMFHWPDKSFSLGVEQALASKSSGLLVRPTIQFRICPTYGGSNPGVRAELVHTLREELSLICGGSYAARPSVFASVSLGRSKWNGNIGSAGVVARVETPVGGGFIRPSFTVQLNSGVEL